MSGDVYSAISHSDFFSTFPGRKKKSSYFCKNTLFSVFQHQVCQLEAIFKEPPDFIYFILSYNMINKKNNLFFKEFLYYNLLKIFFLIIFSKNYDILYLKIFFLNFYF